MVNENVVDADVAVDNPCIVCCGNSLGNLTCPCEALLPCWCVVFEKVGDRAVQCTLEQKTIISLAIETNNVLVRSNGREDLSFNS